MKKLKTLIEHDAEIEQRELDARRNGIACDKCGAEMLDSDWGEGRYRNIYCSHIGCDHRARRLIGEGY